MRLPEKEEVSQMPSAADTKSSRGKTAVAVIPIETPTLGDRCYLVHDGEAAFVVDPQRDIDRVLALLEDRGLRLTHVFESHIHNDYVTGGLALARRTGAEYLVNAADQVSFERTPVRDGEVLRIGPRMRVTAVATPGHTFTHLSYVLADAGEQTAVFSGGSLLYGATATGNPADWVAGTGAGLASFATATFADLTQVRHHRTLTVLDVRRTDESGASRIRGSVNIPLHELPGRLAEVPAGEIWVHCAAGYRASIAASFLAAAGREPVAVDDAFGNARQAGLPVTGDEAA